MKYMYVCGRGWSTPVDAPRAWWNISSPASRYPPSRAIALPCSPRSYKSGAPNALTPPERIIVATDERGTMKEGRDEERCRICLRGAAGTRATGFSRHVRKGVVGKGKEGESHDPWMDMLHPGRDEYQYMSPPCRLGDKSPDGEGIMYSARGTGYGHAQAQGKVESR